MLVNTNIEKAPYPVPPLGLCLLAACLENRYEVRIYDGVFDEGRNLVEEVLRFQPDFIGFSIRNIDDVVIDRHLFYVEGILERFIRPVQAIIHVPVILGGSGFSIFPEELMQLTGADYGIIGEAEQSLPALLHCIETNTDTEYIHNLVTAQQTKIRSHFDFSYPTPTDFRFSEIDRRIDFQPYLARGVYSIQTKRGCSHGCIYCTYPLIEGKRFRVRSPEDIADEIEQAHQRIGNITFEFVDSTFNDPKGHAEAICREIIHRKIKVRLRTMGINPGHCSEELFELMMEAGFAQIDATPDSASPLVLKNLDKGFKLPEIEKMAGLIKKYNLPTMWFFLFGGPGEDAWTFQETLDFIDSYVNPDDMVYMTAGLRIYPNTPLYDLACWEGNIRKEQSIFQKPAYYFSKALSKTHLDQLIRKATETRHNCIPAIETAPPPEMIKEAMILRETEMLTEPTFRTLIRIRKRWRSEGRL